MAMQIVSRQSFPGIRAPGWVWKVIWNVVLRGLRYGVAIVLFSHLCLATLLRRRKLLETHLPEWGGRQQFSQEGHFQGGAGF